MEVFLLNVIGSAAAASGVIAGIIATRLSREMAHAHGGGPAGPGPDRREID